MKELLLPHKKRETEKERRERERERREETEQSEMRELWRIERLIGPALILAEV